MRAGARVIITNASATSQEYLGLVCVVMDAMRLPGLVYVRPVPGSHHESPFYWSEDRLLELPPDLTDAEEVLTWLDS